MAQLRAQHDGIATELRQRLSAAEVRSSPEPQNINLNVTNPRSSSAVCVFTCAMGQPCDVQPY